MNRPRFTIGGILAFVLSLAVGLAALKEATSAWDGGALGVLVVVLLASVLLAAHRRGSRRAYWLGFALFGWTYFGLGQVPTIEARLPTTWGLTSLDSLMAERPNTGTGSSGGIMPRPRMLFGFPEADALSISTGIGGTIVVRNAATGRPVIQSTASTENFVRIGHSLCALILAWLGAIASRDIHDREAARPGGITDRETLTNSPLSTPEPAGPDGSIPLTSRSTTP